MIINIKWDRLKRFESHVLGLFTGAWLSSDFFVFLSVITGIDERIWLFYTACCLVGV